MKVWEITRKWLLTVRDLLRRLSAKGRSLFLSARFWVFGILLVIALLVTYYVLANRYTPFTTDAYVQAFVIQVASQVEGQVVQVHVLENQSVKKGDLLFEVDPRPFEYRVALLEARLDQATKQVAQTENQLTASKADIARSAAEESYARAVREQETEIRKQLATTERRYLHAISQYQVAQADHKRSQAMTRKTVEALATQKAIVTETKAQLADAGLNLKWTKTYAPTNGYITNMQLRVGSYAHTGIPVLTCIDTDQWWVVANCRENSLEYLRPGQRVGLSFNTYPGRIFKGVVQTVGWGVYEGQAAPSGNLPTVSEPKNWIRLAQRFQVWVTPEMHPAYPLRIGATATVAVYTRDKFWLNGVTRFWHKIVSLFDYIR
jgi:multidrug resistance efflux pump